MQALFFGLAFLVGLSNPLQSAANAALNKGLGQPLISAVVVYAVAIAGLLACAGIAMVSGVPLTGFGQLRTVPWWAFVGGLCQLTFTLAAAVSTQKMGSAAFTVTVLVVAVVLSIVLDANGLMGLPMREASWSRLLGAALAVAGVALVS